MSEDEPNQYVYLVVVASESDNLGRTADRVFTELDTARERCDEIESEMNTASIIRRGVYGEESTDSRPVPYTEAPKLH